MAPDQGFWAWLEAGIAAGYCTDLACDTHDLLPSTPAEDEAWDAGSDPCRVVTRLFPDGRPPDLSPR